MSDVTGFGGRLLRGEEWRGEDFAGLRVAVIATGREASVIVPSVVRTARAVKVFQEQPDWFLPPLPPLLPPLLPRRLAGTAARIHLRLAVRDPWTRHRLTPDGRFDRRRTRCDGGYYAALQAPTCTLISWPVYALVTHGVRSAEGVEHHVDRVIVGDSVDVGALSNRPGPRRRTRREDLPA